MTEWYKPSTSEPVSWPTVGKLNDNVRTPAGSAFYAAEDGSAPVLEGQDGKVQRCVDFRPWTSVTDLTDDDRDAKDNRQGLYGDPAKEGHAGVGRAAISMASYPPPRLPDTAVPGGRRPVVAILDTRIGSHDWLDGSGDDRCWVDARALDWPRMAEPVADEGGGDVTPPDGKLDTHAGHGTFIAGLIRQIAPDATVLSLPLMHGDGHLNEDDVLTALEWLRDRSREAVADPDAKAGQFVDVVSMSFGYYERDDDDRKYTQKLANLLGDLGSLGIRVVASAGNHGQTAPVYPAALADTNHSPKPLTALVSVGARNPDGSQAKYSNYGPWVSQWDIGTAVISTIPSRFGSVSALGTPTVYSAHGFGSGFARWGGTSFSTAAFAGRLARALTDGAQGDSMLALTTDAAHGRAAAALTEAQRRADDQFEGENGK
jgi:hypothetical protein